MPLSSLSGARDEEWGFGSPLRRKDFGTCRVKAEIARLNTPRRGRVEHQGAVHEVGTWNSGRLPPKSINHMTETPHFTKHFGRPHVWHCEVDLVIV